MADQNIALGVQVPDAFKSISGMLNFAGQAQQLRSAQQEYERGGVALERERRTLEPAVSEAETRASRARQALPLEIRTLQAQSEAARTGADKAALELQTRNADIARNTVSALASNPAFIAGSAETRRHILESTEKYLNAQGLPSQPGGAVAQTHELIDKNASPDDMLAHIRGFIQQGASPSEKAQVLNTPLTPVGTGGGTQPTQLQPNAATGLGPQGPSIPNTLGPGQLETVQPGPDNQPYVVTRNPAGTVTGTRSLAEGGPTMPRFNPGDAEAVPVLEAERTAARQSLASAPIAHTTNRGILEEIDKVTTGAAGPTLQKLASTLGVKFESAEQRASAYDLIGKYLERNAIEAAKSMGPHTNAGLESAIKANGSVAYNPTAIKTLTKLNDAIVSGAELYQPALEKAIAANPQRGVLAKREFDQAWGQNFDPRIMQLETAVANGDAKEIESIKKSLGPKGVQELLRKAQNLRTLSTQGRL